MRVNQNAINLLASAANAQISHITWQNDSLVSFEFAKSKSNQDGEKNLGQCLEAPLATVY